MRAIFAVPVVMFALSLPAAGQDIFQPLRDMVDGMTQPQTQAPKRTTPKPATVHEEPPPLPRARPDDLGGPSAPVVTEPAKPAPPVVASPAMPTPPTVNLPRPRPEVPAEEEAVPEPAEPTPAPAHDAAGAEPSKPDRVFQTACPAMLTGQVEASAVPPISDGQCKVQSPLSVTGVMANGRMIPLTAEVTTDCGMATALPEWIAEVDGYVRAHDNTQIESVIAGTGYMCRNVNNAATGNLSFHAFADALDVVGFKLGDGRSVTVEQGWTGSEAQGSRIVKFAHDAACGHFTTTLGPEANALHHDHIHIDLGCHGKSCTARICE